MCQMRAVDRGSPIIEENWRESDLDMRSGGEVRRLRGELERERAAAQELREALELAAVYFHAPLSTAEDEAAWQRIVAAIRSGAGRAPVEQERERCAA